MKERRTHRWLLTCASSLSVLLVVFAGCGDDDSGLTTTTVTPQYESVDCQTVLPPGTSPAGVSCGWLTVPENRQRNDGRSVKLPVAVAKATGADPAPDPVIYLNGGPGGSSVEFITGALQRFAPYRERRDIILFDQRGTGRAEPSLDCPEWRDAFTTYIAVSQPIGTDIAAIEDAMQRCRDRLRGNGIDLGMYNSAASALDLHDLMVALGYAQWNLLGISYGTRLALTAMRDAPAGVRSVIIDSVVPVQENLIANFAPDFERALDTFLAACANDSMCGPSLPNLEQTLFQLIDHLNAEPAAVRPTNPATGEPFTVVVTGDRLLLGLQQALYSADLIPLLPLLIDQTSRGRYGLLTQAAGMLAVPSSLAWGMYFSVECYEEAPFVTPAIVAAANANLREQVRTALTSWGTQLELEICAFWGTPPPPATENDPVVSNIPTLVLAGEFDPITRPAYGQLAAQTLSPSYFFQFPSTGHGALADNTPETARPRCAQRVAQEFLDNPMSSPDASCIADVPPLTFFGA